MIEIFADTEMRKKNQKSTMSDYLVILTDHKYYNYTIVIDPSTIHRSKYFPAPPPPLPIPAALMSPFYIAC